jgi:hypothetical protein
MRKMKSDEPFGGRDAPLGASLDEIPSVARRQLAGSLVVAALIAAAAALMAVRPVHNDIAALAPRKSAAIHPPSFVAPPAQHMVSAKQGGIELP